MSMGTGEWNNRVKELIKKDKSCAVILAKLVDESNIYDLDMMFCDMLRVAPFTAEIVAQLINKNNIKDDKVSRLHSVIKSILDANSSCAKIIVKNAIPKMNLKEINPESDFFAVICSLIDADESLLKVFAQWKGFSEFKLLYKKERLRREKASKESQEFFKGMRATFDKIEEQFNQFKYSDSLSCDVPTISQEEAYQTLGVSENASLNEIRKAYRKLAQEYHPDHNKNKSELGQKESEKKMIALNEAYELLGRRSKL
jgi:hypothetical protein